MGLFLEGLYSVGPMYGGKFAFSKSIGLAFSEKEIYHFCFVLLILYSRANSKYKPPGGLFSEGRFNGRFFALRSWGPYIWRGLFLELYGMFFRVFTVKFGLFFQKKKEEN